MRHSWERVAQAYADGLTTRETAARLGFTPNTVRRYATLARASGIETPRPCLKRGLEAKMAEVARLYRAQWTVAAIAGKVGLSERSVVTYATLLRRRGEDVPRAPATGGNPRKIHMAECARLHAEGWTQRRLAQRYGVNQTAISSCLRIAAAAGIETGRLGRWPGRRHLA